MSNSTQKAEDEKADREEKEKQSAKSTKSPAGGKKKGSADPYPTNPPPAAVQEQIRHGGLPADDPRRQPAPESRGPQSDNERLIQEERKRQEDATKATQEQTEREG